MRYEISLVSSPCANGETWEYKLMMHSDNALEASVRKMQIGRSAWRTPLVGDSLDAHAANAFKEIIRNV